MTTSTLQQRINSQISQLLLSQHAPKDPSTIPSRPTLRLRSLDSRKKDEKCEAVDVVVEGHATGLDVPRHVLLALPLTTTSVAFDSHISRQLPYLLKRSALWGYRPDVYFQVKK